MADSISQRFIAELVPVRDQLFADALARVGPGVSGEQARASAESLLLKAVRQVFQQYATLAGGGGVVVIGGVLVAMRQELMTPETAAAHAPPTEPMSAATWARLAAAVQIEAATLPGAKALNPDSVLLFPDPLLAPKKPKPQLDQFDPLDLSPTSRFVTGALIALVLGLAVTIFLTTRRHTHSVPEPLPATEPADTYLAPVTLPTPPASQPTSPATLPATFPEGSGH